MMPNRPMQGGPGGPMGVAGGPGGGPPMAPGGGGPGEGQNPDAIKQQLVMLLSKAKEVAEQNGIDFGAIVAEIEGNKSRSDVPLPRPPSPSLP